MDALLILAGVVTLASLVLLYRAYSYKNEQKKLLLELQQEASRLVDRLKKRSASIDAKEKEDDYINDYSGLLSSPTYLSTLCTVIVRKFGGQIVLNKDDFDSLSAQDYVSVYVDTNNDCEDIYLCLNSTYPGEDPDSDEEIVYN